MGDVGEGTGRARFVCFTIHSKVRNLTRLTSDKDFKFEDKDF
jgi:hypothetical protein